jgi:hypothetical protein
MAVQSSPVLPQTPFTQVAQFSTTSAITTVAGSTFTTLCTGGVNGSKITSVMVSNTSTQAAITGILAIGSTVSGAQLFYPLASTVLPALGTGFTAALVPVTLFSTSGNPLPVDGDGNPYLFLTSTAYTLSVGIGSSIQTTGGRVSFVAIGADF